MMTLRKTTTGDGVYEFRDASIGLVIRGDHPEWVLQAAAEIIGNYSRLEVESRVDELTVMHRLGAANQAELTSLRAEQRRRFDLGPRCSVALGSVDYIWASTDAPRLTENAIPAGPLRLGPDMLVPRAADPQAA